jgi:GDPmannose 4,6-dehydratase
MKRALITGLTGQDGSFLAELLLDRGYEVWGLARAQSWVKPNCSSHLADRVKVVFGDLCEGTDIAGAVEAAKPDEVYNLASQSRPGESWVRATETLNVNGLGALRLFEAVRHQAPAARIYHASSSEMFGPGSARVQNEQTPFNPANPYAAAKVYAHQMARIYRESYGMYIANGILFNHESERRPLHFVTQKIAYGAACAALGIVQSPDLNERGVPIVSGGRLMLGSLNVARDWGYAGDFVQAIWLMLQQPKPDDFVVGTGKVHSLGELCGAAYHAVGLDWTEHVMSDPALVRPIETAQTVADPSKAHTVLGWHPTVQFTAMVERMVENQLARLRAQGHAGKRF